MPHASRTIVVDWLIDIGLLPVIRVDSPDHAIRAARALADGGVPVAEVTMTVPGALDAIAAIARNRETLVGAGTVLRRNDAEACMDAGARFIVTPILEPDVITACHQRDVPVAIGALTPSEVWAAWRLGADLVKVFPAHAVGGAEYLRALRGPLPAVRVVPTGGVTLTTTGDFIRAGAVAVGVGSALVRTSLLAAGHDHVISERARAFYAAVHAARSETVAP